MLIAATRLARVCDPLLARSGRVLPEMSATAEEFLDRHIAECVALRRYFFLRLAHLADAVGRIPEPITDVLAVGAGMAYQEAFLAARLPALRVLATDATATHGAFPVPNLRFGQLDLLDAPGEEQFDLVSSIEVLEHIQDYRRAFAHKAARVRPGKYLYLSVPFASREQQNDPRLRDHVWRECAHYTPGFTFEDLETLFDDHGFDVLHASNMFHLDVVLPVRQIVETLGDDETFARAGALARLLLLDVEDRRVVDSRHSEGIRVLGRKRQTHAQSMASRRRAVALPDPQLMDDLVRGRFAFVDGGCGRGGSMDQCERRFNQRPGLGFDEAAADLAVATDRGFVVTQCDVSALELPRRCVSFASLMDVLEHLPDVAAAERVLAQFGGAARDFLFIRHPSFEDVEYLASHGLKFGWTDWTLHPNRMRLADLHGIFERLGWRDVVVIPELPVTDSSHPAIVPLEAAADSEEYIAALHGPKPAVAFDRPVFGKFDIFVRLNPDLPDDDWRRIATSAGWHGTWDPPGKRKIAEDTAVRSHMRRRPPATESDAGSLADSLIRRYTLHDAPPTDARRGAWRAALVQCAMQPDHGLLHAVHLLDAFNATTGVRRVFAPESGSTVHARLLAARVPTLTVDDVGAGDGAYDLVVSLDRHGHPRLDEVRVRALLAAVRPGGWLYLTALTPADTAPLPIEQWLRQADYGRIASTRMFAREIANALATLTSVLDVPIVDASLCDLLRMALGDLEPAHGPAMGAPLASRYLIRRRT